MAVPRNSEVCSLPSLSSQLSRARYRIFREKAVTFLMSSGRHSNDRSSREGSERLLGSREGSSPDTSPSSRPSGQPSPTSGSSYTLLSNRGTSSPSIPDPEIRAAIEGSPYPLTLPTAPQPTGNHQPAGRLSFNVSYPQRGGTPASSRHGSNDSLGSKEGTPRSTASSSRRKSKLMSTRQPSTGCRACFICLEDDSSEELVGCCSQCYAMVHRRCWREWRSNQRLNHIRSRLLGYAAPNPSLCTICKTGVSRVIGEEEGGAWDGSSPVAGDRRSAEAALQDQFLETLSRVLRNSDDDDDDLDEPPLCAGPTPIFGAALIFLVIVFDLVFISMTKAWAGDVVLLSLLAIYEFFVMQLVIMAIYQRRTALQSFLTWPIPEPERRADRQRRQRSLMQLSALPDSPGRRGGDGGVDENRRALMADVDLERGADERERAWGDEIIS
ncbi:unnamed protein product [Vitrella brassicaformis CCMP3155]|uniref:RING-CH-type domain-containing protein n=2 Tax=Vitrella brassicaformis TaxID=1169539 RepID=A0A0G4H629_VITBC|nr:unnamed protein product [Vitrella brassicaformis CCMP3155]|eukprot:CEM39312.1 unnamed protein product [Vitrella brassicaformis CCMP3155]